MSTLVALDVDASLHFWYRSTISGTLYLSSGPCPLPTILNGISFTFLNAVVTLRAFGFIRQS